MKTNEIMAKASGLLHRANFQLKKHSPEILLIGGLISVVAGGVMACKATMKADTIVKIAKTDVANIRKLSEKSKSPTAEEEANKEINRVYMQTTKELAKIYIPAVTMEAAGIISILASHNIMGKRNAALASAYAAIDRSFKQYRSRVVERLGEDADLELRTGSKPVQVEETVTDEKTGKEKKVKKTVQVVDESEISDYARFFDDTCNGYERNPNYTDMYIRAQEVTAQTKLVGNGYLFLNDVYDLFGIERSKAGQVVGWLYDKNDPTGDNRVRITSHIVKRDTGHGIEDAILLDFNVDGYILEDAHIRKLLN